MQNLREIMMGRFGDNADGWRGPAKIELSRILDTHDQVRAEHARIAADPNLSALGKQDATRKYLATTASKHLVRAQRSVETMRGKIAERRANLRPPVPDKTDASAAILRSEMRSQLRGMKQGERMQLLLAPDADPALIAAALEAPNFSSGITDQTRTLLTNSVIEKRYPGASAALESAEDAVEILTAAVQVTERTVYAAGDFPSGKVFSDFIAQAVPNTAHIEAELNRNFSTMAEIAA
jgi:hypothetical protein